MPRQKKSRTSSFLKSPRREFIGTVLRASCCTPPKSKREGWKTISAGIILYKRKEGICGAILNTLGNLKQFWNHFGTVFKLSLRHLQVSIFTRPNVKKNKPVRAIFWKLEIVFFAHFWVHFLTTVWPIFGPPLGVSLSVSWEPSRGSWDSLKNLWIEKH